MPKIDLNQIQQIAMSRIQGLMKGRPGVKKALGPVTVIGCDYGAYKILTLEMEKGIGKPFIKKFDLQQRPDKEAPALIRQIFDGGYEKRQARSSVKGQSVLVRFIQFPKMTKPELASAIKYEAENYIPFKSDEVLMDFHILGDVGGKNMMDVLLIAVKKEQVYSLIKDFQGADVQLDCIDADVFAMINAIEFFYPEEFASSAGFLDIGSEISTLSIIREGQPRFIRDISFGGIDITKRLRRKLGLTKENSEKILNLELAAPAEALAVIRESYETLCADLKVTLDYYQQQAQDAKPIEKMILAGGAGDPALTAAILSECLGLPVQHFNVVEKVDLADTVNKELFAKSQHMLAVAMGLCLRNDS